MRCEYAYHSRFDGEGLRTVGVLVISPTQIAFFAPKLHAATAAEFNQQFAALREKMKPSDIFSYYIDSGNGVTTEWSEPGEAEGADIETVAAELLAQV